MGQAPTSKEQTQVDQLPEQERPIQSKKKNGKICGIITDLCINIQAEVPQKNTQCVEVFNPNIRRKVMVPVLDPVGKNPLFERRISHKTHTTRVDNTSFMTETQNPQ